MPAKAEGIGYAQGEVCPDSNVGGVVQVAFRIRNVQVDGGRADAFLEGKDSEVEACAVAAELLDGLVIKLCSLAVILYEGGGVQNLNVDGGIFINTEVRAYSMLPVTSSKIFPHLGLGGKVGASFSPFIYRYFGHTGYIGLYGYLPGLVSTHGLHLNLDASRSFGSDFFTLSSLGFQADYALPFGALDWSGLSPWMYLRNFELTGHADLSFSNAAYKLSDRNEPLRRHSVGASLAMHLGNFLWIPFDTLLGLKYMYCLTDPSLSALTMVFSMDIK